MSWITRKRRLALYERDNWTCHLCGKTVAETGPRENIATLDHLVSRFVGGGHEDSNLATACMKCNSERRGLDVPAPETYVPASRHDLLGAVLRDESPYTSQQRLLLVTLAQLADWKTGRGLAGQSRIARTMGVSVRQVQRLRAEVAAMRGPIGITWLARGCADGRTSDAYRLVIAPSCRETPVKSDSLEGKADSLSGNQIQGSTSVDSPGDLLQEKKIPPVPGTPAVADPGRGIGGGVAGRGLLPPDWTPRPREVAMAAEWGRDLSEAAASFRAHAAAAGRLARDWDAAFELWLLRGRKPAHEAARRQEWQAARAARRETAARSEFAAAITAAGGLGTKPVAGMRSRLAADRRLLGQARRLLGAARGVQLSSEQLAALVAIAAGQP